MAKVKIVKGGLTKEVSNSAYKNFFKSAGWTLEGAVKEEIKDDTVVPFPEDNVKDSSDSDDLDNSSDSDDDWDEDENDKNNDDDEDVDKPISEMNGTELREFAKLNGIDLTGLSTNKQIREAIKAFKE